MVRLCHQLEHFDIDGDEADELPRDKGAHLAGEPRGRRWVVGLLVGVFVGVWHGGKSSLIGRMR